MLKREEQKMPNYEDDHHAERRDAKRDGRKKMAVKGRSIFTIQETEHKRIRTINVKSGDVIKCTILFTRD